MQTTLQLLPVSLTLVSIPRNRVPSLSSQIIRQILQPSPAKFLNISSNEIELSIFAESHTLAEFEEIARKDRQRQRSRSGSFSSRLKGTRTDFMPVEVSYEQWSVLQVDSHSDSLDTSGARVNELSAPLAAAGISILYQSSYLSDFIFVKESRLPETLALLANAGFDLYAIDENSLSSLTIPMSPPLTPNPILEAECKSIMDVVPSTPAVAPGSVLTRTRSAPNSGSPSSPRARTPSEPCPRKEASPEYFTRTPSKAKTSSPMSGEVHLLDSDLTCVGLADDSVDYWSSKIIKLVAYPDLIPCPSRDNKASQPETVDRSAARRSPSSQSLADDQSSPYMSDDEDREDGYFSHSPNLSTSSLLTSLTSPSSRSSTDLSGVPDIQASGKTLPVLSGQRPYSKHLMGFGGPLSPLSPIQTEPEFLSRTPTAAVKVPKLNTMSLSPERFRRAKPESPPPRVPFFSITRTPEGSSLTTDAELLAMLFPAKDRYMVICGGELEAADQRIVEGRDSREDVEESDDDLDQSLGSSMLKCLQLDLRKFGLDKHGLVNRFSRVLEENKINHMYSSTFKTANLLVDKRYAVRAQTLLRAC
ncbi:hypothetical protein PQX77_008503 [Marasmius sp. AFHP31]|nr:hypothetical protein PQX77_008503 [Marasmius sp. AFHP31]